MPGTAEPPPVHSARLALTRVRELLTDAPWGEQAVTEAQRYLRRSGGPLRVAVVGKVGSGKSTTVNGLFVPCPDGWPGLPTGEDETTATLIELRQANRQALIQHFDDGTSCVVPLEKLRQYGAALDAPLPDSPGPVGVDRLEATLDSQVLAGIRLIDTPGFGSVQGLDSRSRDLITREQVNAADALVYVLNLPGDQRDLEHVRLFTGSITAAAALGVIAYGNQSWSERARTWAAGQYAAHDLTSIAPEEGELLRLHQEESGYGLFHALVVVNSLLAEGASLCDDADLDALRALAAVDSAMLLDSLVAKGSRRRGFHHREDFPLSGDQRQRLIDGLSDHGVWTAVETMKSQPSISIPELRLVLDQASGMPVLRALVQVYFGAHGATLRAAETLTLVQTCVDAASSTLGAGHPGQGALREAADILARARSTIDVVINALGAFTHSLHGTWRLSETARRSLLRLTAHESSSTACLLGLGEDASAEEIRRAALAEVEFWACQSAGFSGPDLEASEALRRLCEQLFARRTEPACAVSAVDLH